MRLPIILFLLLPLSLFAQDSYHTSLTNLLATDYGLPQGNWLFHDNETNIYQEATHYGGSFGVETVAGQDFTRLEHCVISNAGNDPWASGWKVSNNMVIQNGDKLLAVFYLRSLGGEGEVNFFVEDNVTYNKEIYLNLPLSGEWRAYFIPIESMDGYPVGDCAFGFHMANVAQTVEIGGFTAINFGSAVALDDLPSEVNNQFYGGYEVDAPWRAEADARIEQIRKADFQLNVRSTDGEAIADAAVELNMLRHRFDFGSAILASRIAGNNGYNATYEDKIINLDGNGHGFNAAVFENDLKWDGWEEEWLASKPEIQDAVSWLKAQNLKIRGHNLVWPGTQYLPVDIPQNYDNLPYLKQRIDGHLEEIMLYPGIGPEIHDWDVLNEITANQDLANAFAASPDYATGRELYAEIFEKAREVDPEVGLWLNDYVTMSLNTAPGDMLYDRFKQYVQELVDAGVDIQGLGFQGHIGGIPNSIYDVLATLDDFHQTFGLGAKITEFDLPGFLDEELAANYLRDFMTAIYSHESTDGFLFWSFWDGQTYMNEGSNLYREDWSETPAHAAFTDLLFNQWWSEEALATASDGRVATRIFKGTYELVYECDGETIRDTIDIATDTDYEIVCDNITTGAIHPSPRVAFKLYPNPAHDHLTLERDSDQTARIRLLDTTGRTLSEQISTDRRLLLDLQGFRGVLVVEVSVEGEVYVERVVVE